MWEIAHNRYLVGRDSRYKVLGTYISSTVYVHVTLHSIPLTWMRWGCSFYLAFPALSRLRTQYIHTHTSTPQTWLVLSGKNVEERQNGQKWAKRFKKVQNSGVTLRLLCSLKILFFKGSFDCRLWGTYEVIFVTTFGAQSFTSLKEDLYQNLNGGFAISRCLNGTFPWRKCSVKALVT